MDKPKGKRLIDELEENDSFLSKYHLYRRVDKQKAWTDFCHRVNIRVPNKTSWWTIYKYAAILLLPVSILAIWLLLLSKPSISIESLSEVVPGNSQAVLILSNGNQIDLDSTAMDSLPVGGATVATIKDNHITYGETSQAALEEYNTLLTKRGGEYRIVLEDGTKVHLNADSQLKYPVGFSKDERKVYLEGEAYFEIAHDAKRPFYVVTDKMTVRQYGTAFNINAYPDEDAAVVLVRGNVGVITGGSERMISPGQLAELKNGSNQLVVKNVDVEAYTAWNEGRFFFDNQSLKDITDILSRWYNIDIRFKTDGIQQLHFTGSLDRYDTIEPIIQAISSTVNVKVEVKGHVLYISR